MKRFAVIITTFICTILVLDSTNIRVTKGEVTSRTYIESADYINTELTTSDNEIWVAEGYTAPIGDKVLIIYDKCDTSTIYDDEILYIIHFTEFTN